MATRRKTPPLRLDQMRDHYAKNRDRLTGFGECVQVFFLPLSMCKRQNTKFGSQGWQAAKDRRETLGYMRMQCPSKKKPLEGRPYVRCLRFSSSEPDKYSDWAKVAIDCLCAPNKQSPHRIGIIVDDAPKFAEIDQQWREAKPGKGFCVIEIWTGAER